tara:strand:- start:532 stop:1131 length:600 start_codon:yes stop_codon:yes gene_type:complete
MIEQIRALIRGILFKLKINSSYIFLRSKISIACPLKIYKHGKIYLGKAALLTKLTDLIIFPKSKLSVGEGSVICRGSVIIVTNEAELKIGKKVYIGELNNFRCTNRITIGNSVKISQLVTIVDGQHKFSDKNFSIGDQGYEKKSVTIEDNAWIGANSVILPGVIIGKGAVVGAGSVVTTNVPEYSVAAGNPAKIIKKRI